MLNESIDTRFLCNSCPAPAASTRPYPMVARAAGGYGQSEAALGIAVILKEGAAAETVGAVNNVCEES